MVESLMYFCAGFLVASLLALVLISFVHRRAVRLTLRRLEDAIPVSLAEIQADKDKLRAEFAMSARRLELTIEQLKAKATNQLGEIARKTEAIAKLKAQLAEKTAATDALDARSRSLSARMQEAEQEHAVQFATAETTARALADREAKLARAAIDINDLTLTSDTQKVEIALLKTQIEQFKSRISELEREAEETCRAERAENDLLRERVADIAAQVAHMSMDKAGSPAAELLKEAQSIRPTGFERVASRGEGEQPGGNLADRIRKLQKAPSRASTAS